MYSVPYIERALLERNRKKWVKKKQSLGVAKAFSPFGCGRKRSFVRAYFSSSSYAFWLARRSPRVSQQTYNKRSRSFRISLNKRKVLAGKWLKATRWPFAQFTGRLSSRLVSFRVVQNLANPSPNICRSRNIRVATCFPPRLLRCSINIC